MVKEKILNSFISSNMQSVGLHHVNSEVPKVVAEHIGKRTDILGFDLDTSIPIILELKVKKDLQVVSQLQEYIALVSKKYPNLFEELNAFRHLEDFQFNFRRGIVDMVLSPEPPPESIADQGSTILWAQFSLSDNGIFQIVSRKTLSKSTTLASSFKNRPPFKPVPPSQFVASSLPNTVAMRMMGCLKTSQRNIQMLRLKGLLTELRRDLLNNLAAPFFNLHDVATRIIQYASR